MTRAALAAAVLIAVAAGRFAFGAIGAMIEDTAADLGDDEDHL